MDYIGNKCPVCDKYFHADDDVVVCPDCGTPHHRECYEQLGHCSNEELHAQGYDYQKETAGEKEDAKLCPSCGKPNDKNNFFCAFCGAPLSQNEAERNTANQQTGSTQGFPFGVGGSVGGQNGAPNFMDPLAGVPNDTDFGDDVTAGEMAKYVKQNTPYFIRVFNNIKTINKSKFNFSAALFTGGYLLYRKMYKLGALFAGLQLALLIVETYITIAYSSLYADFINLYTDAFSSGNVVSAFYSYLQGLSFIEILILYLPTLMDLIRIAMMIVFGICFNRMYFKHCKKQILKIKATAKDGENPETTLQTKGGVNTPLAISLMVTYMILVYLPNLITYFL